MELPAGLQPIQDSAAADCDRCPRQLANYSQHAAGVGTAITSTQSCSLPGVMELMQ